MILLSGMILLQTAVAMSNSMSASTVTIVGLQGGMTQSLPVSYVDSFQRWIVGSEGQVMSRSCSTGNELEWSSGDVWQVRPCLDVLIKSGAPAYLMSGLQLRNMTGNDEISKEICPLARQWTSFSFAVEPIFRIEMFVTTSDVPVDGIHNELLPTRKRSDAVAGMKQAMESFSLLLPQMEENSPMSEGFHILSIPLELDGWTSLPTPEPGGQYTVTCLATAEPTATELLGMDDTLLEMTGSSVLELSVVPSAVDEESSASLQDEL